MADLSQINPTGQAPLDPTISKTFNPADFKIQTGLTDFSMSIERRVYDPNYLKMSVTLNEGVVSVRGSTTITSAHQKTEFAIGFGKKIEIGPRVGFNPPNLFQGKIDTFVGIGFNTDGQAFGQLQGTANFFGNKINANIKTGVQLNIEGTLYNAISSAPSDPITIPAIIGYTSSATVTPRVSDYVTFSYSATPFSESTVDISMMPMPGVATSLKFERNPKSQVDPNPYSVSDPSTLNKFATGYYGPNTGDGLPAPTPSTPISPANPITSQVVGSIAPGDLAGPLSPLEAPRIPVAPGIPYDPSKPGGGREVNPGGWSSSYGDFGGGGTASGRGGEGNGGNVGGGVSSVGGGMSGSGGSQGRGNSGGGSRSSTGSAGGGGGRPSGGGGQKTGGGLSGGGIGSDHTIDPDHYNDPGPQYTMHETSPGGYVSVTENPNGIPGTYGWDKSPSSPGDGSSASKPVLIDLDGNGINIDPLSSSTQFLDLNGDGYLHRTAWAGKGTGVLVIDTNNDGKINQSNEFVFTEWDKSASSDLEAIRNVFDTNHNGKLDAGDARWGEFKVMVDGVMKTLGELGIASIDLTPKGSGQNFTDGSSIKGTSQYTRTDGTTGTVGDAVLVSESNGYVLKRTSTTNADGSTNENIVGYDRDGRLAFSNNVTTSADGLNKFTYSDDDGNGVADRSQYDNMVIGADGSRTRTITNVRQDGSVADKTTVITSADKKTITTNLDQDGDGKTDQSETVLSNADGSTLTTTKAFSVDGTLIKQVSVTASADGLTKTTRTDSNGDGVFERVSSEITVLNGDGTRTKTVDARNSDGSLISRTETVTSTDNRSKTVKYDHTGTGIFDECDATTISVDGTGNVTTTTLRYNSDGSLRDKSVVSLNANGLSKTTSTDLTGDGVADRITTDVTVVGADKSRVQTVEQKSADGTLLSRMVTRTSGDGKTISVEEDRNGDGVVDVRTTTLINANGTTTQTVETFNPNGTLISKTLTEALTDAIGRKISVDLNGDGVYDQITGDGIYIYGDQTRHIGFSLQGNNGTLKGKTETGYSLDGLTKTTDKWINSDGVIDETIKDVTVLNADGSRTQTVTTRSGDGTLLANEVTLVSTDRKTTTVTTDADGDGIVDRTIVQVQNANGSTTTTTTLTTASGAVYGKTIATVSADGLTKTLAEDLNGDGAVDRTTVDATLINTNGSRTRTITETNGDGSLLSQTVTTVSANGLIKTATVDLDGDGTIDSGSTETTVINADGSITTTTQEQAGSVNTAKTITTVSANGLVSTTQTDIDGDGTIDSVATTTKLLNADGSTSVTSVVKSGNGTLLSQFTTTTSADGKNIAIEQDANGDGAVDARKSIVLGVDGTRTETTSSFSPDGLLVGRTIVETTANGLSKKTSVDVNGDGTVDTITTDVTVLNVDGSKTNTTIITGTTGAIISKIVTTLSADELSKTVEEDLTGDGVADKVTTTSIVINANGSRAQTVTTKSGNGTLLGKTTTLVSGDGKTKTVTTDENGDGKTDETKVSVLNADGSTTTTVTEANADGSVYARTVTTVSADGFTVTTLQDFDGDGVYDRTIIDKTIINANGSHTQTITTTSSNGTLLDKTTINISANGLIKTTARDINGDGIVDTVSEDKTVITGGSGTVTVHTDGHQGSASGHIVGSDAVITSANGLSQTVTTDIDGNGTIDQRSETVKTVKADGTIVETTSRTTWNNSLVAKSVTTTSANGRNITIEDDLNGDGVIDMRTSIMLNTDGTTTKTVSEFKADGSLNSKSVTDTWPNGLATTTKVDLDGNGTFDRTTTDVITPNTDGSKTRTIQEFDAGNVLTGKTVVVTSATGLTRTMTWTDGAGASLRSLSQTTTINADGSTVQVQTYFRANGSLESRTTTTLSADALTKSITSDINGDGVVDQRSVSVKNADGSLVTTLTDYAADGTTIIDTKKVTTSANGLIETTDYDTDGNGTVDLRTVQTTVFNANGSKTQTTDTFAASGGSLTLKVREVADISADGLTKDVQWDIDGSGILSRRQTVTTVLNSDGSRTQTITKFAGTVVNRRHIITTSADGLTVTTKRDMTGSGTYDQSATDVTTLNADGTKTRTVNITKADGSLVSKSVTTQSADGRTIMTQEDRVGQASRILKNVSDVLADRSVVNTATTSSVAGLLLDKTVTTTSPDKRCVTIERDADGDGKIDQSEQRIQAVDGSVTSTITGLRTDGTIANRTTSRTSADGLTTIIEFDTDGDGVTDRRRTTVNAFNADGSQRSVMIDTDDTGKLAAKTTVSVSADGRTSITSRDTNGNDTVDQIDTRIVEVNGAITETVVNNAEARELSNLIVGQVNWTKAIAAKIQTSVWLDGLTKIVSFDYDGNGTYEVVIVEEKQLDGSSIATITETNADGSVKARGMRTTSADGLITILSKDANNDGIYDRIETSIAHRDGSITLTAVDKNADGSLKQTVVDTITASGKLLRSLTTDAQGRKTAETLLAADGTTTVSAFEAASGQILSIARVNKKGVLTTATLYDPLNANPWSRVEQTFNADGKKTMEIQYMDDGTRAEITFNLATGKDEWINTFSASGKLSGQIILDPENTHPWSRFERIYNSNAVLTGQVVTNDDGSRDANYWDPDNSQTWEHITQAFNSAGQKLSETQYMDDGTRWLILYDYSTQPLTRYEQNFDTSGRLVFQNNVNHDGTRSTWTWDQANAQSWSRIEQSFDTANRLVYQNQFNRDGTRLAISLDPSNSQTWSRAEQTFDTAGRLTYQYNFNHDGSRIAYTWDQAGTQSWSRIEQTFDGAARLVYQNQFNRDGTRLAITLDPANTQPWYRAEQYFDTANRLTYQMNYNDDGTKTAYTYDAANAQYWSNVTQYFNTAGQKTFERWNNDDGTRDDNGFNVDNSSNRTWWGEHYDAQGRRMYETIYYNDGSHDSNGFDYANTSPMSWWGSHYDAQNRKVSETDFYDNGSRISYTFDAYNTAIWAIKYDVFNAAGQRTEADQINDDGTRTQWFVNDRGNIVGTRQYDRWGNLIPPNDEGGPGSHGQPVLLDLNGDNHIDLRPFHAAEFANNAGPRFDWDGDGVRDGTAWVGPQDGMLAIDLGSNGQAGGDGVIDQAREIAFSLWATPEDIAALGHPASDLEGLRLAFDTNHDGVLDDKDARWNEFRVWQDANQNGISDPGELKTMSEAGIKLINLIPSIEGATQFPDGSALTGTSSYEMLDGTTRRLVGDATLAYRSSQANVPAA